MIESKSRVAIYCRLSEEDRNKQSETDDSHFYIAPTRLSMS